MTAIERSRRAGLLTLLGLSTTLALTACGSSATNSAPAKLATPAQSATTSPSTQDASLQTHYPLTIENCGERETFTKPPTRVLIMNGASVAEVEDFIELGLQKDILANAQSYGTSDVPGVAAEIAAIPTHGLKLNQNYDVPREEVLGLQPDLVVSTWSGGFSAKSGFATRSELASVGINSLVTPANCANGATDPTPSEQYAYTHQTVSASFQMLSLLGEIFNVQARANAYIAKEKKELAAAEALNAGKPPKSVLVVYPGMSAAMSTNGVPAVFGGGIFDNIIELAGGTNPFAGDSNAQLEAINNEALANAKVDVLVVGLYGKELNGPQLAASLFKEFPQWQASKTKTYTTVSDSYYLGPFAAVAVQRIATAIHSLDH